MDYENVYYVDSRNATATVTPRDHRVVYTSTPPGAVVTAGAPTATVVRAPTAAFAANPAWATPPYSYPTVPPYFHGGFGGFGGGGFNGGGFNGWNGWNPMQPPYVTSQPSTNLSSILGGFGDIGSLANILAQVFAALMPLPQAPTPQDGKTAGDVDPATNAQNNSSNLIQYQNALALFARRDQQILTLGSVLKELLKRPGMVQG